MKQFTGLKPSTFLMFITLLVLLSCDEQKSSTGETTSDTTMKMEQKEIRHAAAALEGIKPDTTVTGTVSFDEMDGKVKMMLQMTIKDKANQSVAVHIHEHGDCGEMGKAAGGHWNPTNQNHGKWGNPPFHSGDIGNINLDANGNGSLELETDLWSIGGDTTKNILGKTIIIHSGTDDYTSQPSGNAGERIGCGIIRQ